MKTEKRVCEKPQVGQWRRYAAGGDFRVRDCLSIGDSGGAILAATRAEVRRQAATLLEEEPDTAKAVNAMLDLALRNRVIGGPPMDASFDQAMVRYTRARTWQACARELDPTVVDVQDRWD